MDLTQSSWGLALQQAVILIHYAYTQLLRLQQLISCMAGTEREPRCSSLTGVSFEFCCCCMTHATPLLLPVPAANHHCCTGQAAFCYCCWQV